MSSPLVQASLVANLFVFSTLDSRGTLDLVIHGTYCDSSDGLDASGRTSSWLYGTCRDVCGRGLDCLVCRAERRSSRYEVVGR